MSTETMKRLYGGFIHLGGQLLTEWKAGLTPERSEQLAVFEAKGLHPGLLIYVHLNKPAVRVILTDAAGGMTVLDTIALEVVGGAGSLSVN